jgi:RNA polymerase sigma-70 factor (ECF subfamily)
VNRVDPLRDPAPLLRRVYAYVAYRIGDGPDAEDVVSATLERALRYRDSFDPARGEPIAWLLGIAKRSLSEYYERRGEDRTADLADTAGPGDLEGEAVERLTVQRAVGRLSDRDRELLALRYGADLSTRSIARLVHAKPNAVDVALHRALGRLRAELTPSSAATRPRPQVETAARTGALAPSRPAVPPEG